MLIAVGRYEPRDPSGAHQRHRRHASLGPDQARDCEHQVPDQAAGDDRDERRKELECRHEDRARDDD